MKAFRPMNDHLSLESAFLGVNLLSREGKSQTGLTARSSRPYQRGQPFHSLALTNPSSIVFILVRSLFVLFLMERTRTKDDDGWWIPSRGHQYSLSQSNRAAHRRSSSRWHDWLLREYEPREAFLEPKRASIVMPSTDVALLVLSSRKETLWRISFSLNSFHRVDHMAFKADHTKMKAFKKRKTRSVMKRLRSIIQFLLFFFLMAIRDYKRSHQAKKKGKRMMNALSLWGDALLVDQHLTAVIRCKQLFDEARCCGPEVLPHKERKSRSEDEPSRKWCS